MERYYKHMSIMVVLVVEFSCGGKKLEGFSPEDQYTKGNFARA